jgi:hypothetical protein
MTGAHPFLTGTGPDETSQGAEMEDVQVKEPMTKASRRARCGATLFGATMIAAAMASAAPASAADLGRPTNLPPVPVGPPASGPVPAGASPGAIVVEDLDVNGNVVRSQTIPAPSGVATREAGSGTIGSPGRSGCRQVTAYNTGYTATGKVFYRFNVRERVCWDDNKNTVSADSISSYPSNLDRFANYHGLIAQRNGHYNYNGRGSKSGYQTYRQARIENCIVNWGCIGNDYPYVMINAHDDGTIYWQRGGD